MSKAIDLPRRPMAGWLYHLDRILRGEATKPSDIRNADIKIPLFGITFLVFLMAALYGVCMGVFAVVNGFENEAYQKAIMQTVASMCKVPLLFFLTLVVTFPSLYVFNALVGSKLRGIPVLKLLIASLAVNLSVLASMGPILAFFSVSTPNYAFIVLLNVVVFAVAGVLGLVFLIQTLNRLSSAQKKKSTTDNEPSTTPYPAQPQFSQTSQTTEVDPTRSQEEPDDAVELGDVKSPVVSGLAFTDQDTETPATKPLKPKPPGPLDSLEGVVLGHHVRKVFCCWIVLFGLVGAQMGWVLRPFIGSPNKDFSWFRVRNSNFFEAVIQAIDNLMF